MLLQKSCEMENDNDEHCHFPFHRTDQDTCLVLVKGYMSEMKNAICVQVHFKLFLM